MFKKLLTLLGVALLAIIMGHGRAVADPDTLWTRWYGGASDDEAYSVEQTADGGFIIVGCTESFGADGKDVWLIKTDAQGDTLWAKAYGGTGDDEARSVEQTSDGGYILTGSTGSFGAGAADFWLLKTDAQGDTLWTKTYGGGSNEWSFDVDQTADGGYIIVGTMQSFAIAYDDVWLIKTDSFGDSLWTKNWDININDDRGAEVQQTHDGGFIIVGHTYYTGSGNVLDFTLFKTDSLGNTLWTGTYGERKEQRGASVRQTSDSGYVLTGYTADQYNTNPDVYVVKTDSVGDTTWTRTYGGSDWEEGYLVRQTNDGGYFLVGKTNSFGAGGFDVWVLETDANGDTLWTKTYGGTGDDVGYSGQQTADGGYIIAGYTASSGAGGKDVYLIRLAYDVPHVLSTSPTQNELNVSVNSNVSVTFDIDMDETTINSSSFVVNARSTGLHDGTISYNGPTKTATFDPTLDFHAGEVVTVLLTTDIKSSEGISMDSSSVWSFTVVVGAGTGTFAADSVYLVEGGPSSVFAADLDGDGDLDLATANEPADEVGILLNSGDGTFAVDSTYPVYDGPLSVFAVDLDGDGDLDLATANTWSSNVSVLLNNGDATFAPDSLYPVGINPKWIFAADLDADGHMDLVTANGFSDNVSLLFNNGDGTFAPHSVYAIVDRPYAVSAADLDGDCDLDLAISCTSSGDVWIMLNNGDGTFAPDSAYPVGDGSFCIVAADFDADGDLDLATSDAFDDSLSVLLNNGDGTFAPRSVYPVGVEPRSVSAGDLDGDGDLDLATGNHTSNNVSILLGNGDGTFASHVLYSAVAEPYWIFAGDLDGDGDLDLTTANRYWNSLSVLLNQGGSGVDEVTELHPLAFSLRQNYPNPFNPATTIRYEVRRSGYVTLKIFNILGQEVETVVSAKQAAGEYTAEWDAANFTSGVYFYRLQVGEFSETKKLVLLK